MEKPIHVIRHIRAACRQSKWPETEGGSTAGRLTIPDLCSLRPDWHKNWHIHLDVYKRQLQSDVSGSRCSGSIHHIYRRNGNESCLFHSNCKAVWINRIFTCERYRSFTGLFYNCGVRLYACLLYTSRESSSDRTINKTDQQVASLEFWMVTNDKRFYFPGTVCKSKLFIGYRMEARGLSSLEQRVTSTQK